MQDGSQPICINAPEGEGLLIYFMDRESVYQDMKTSKSSDYQRRCKEYADAIVFAASFWKGDVQQKTVHSYDNLPYVVQMCKQFHGGDPEIDIRQSNYSDLDILQ